MRCFLIIVCLVLVKEVHAQRSTLADSLDSVWQQQLQELVKQLGWKQPRLKEDEYEIYVWQRQSLMKGAAHRVYKLSKIGKRICLSDCDIRYPESKRPVTLCYHSRKNVAITDWNRLIDKRLLTLPNWSSVKTNYYASFPKDSTWTDVSSDGTVTVRAKKIRKRVFVSDGESYAFSVSSHNKFRFYTYSNPFSYYREYTDIPELRNVIDILDDLSKLSHN